MTFRSLMEQASTEADSVLCFPSYTKVDKVTDEMCHLGQGTELAKADIKATYPVYLKQ